MSLGSLPPEPIPSVGASAGLATVVPGQEEAVAAGLLPAGEIYRRD